MKWLANALSYGRAGLALPAAWCGIQEAWLAAFVVLVIGILTDAFDGWAARRFGAETQAGKDWVDPICDAILGTGVLIGLGFHAPDKLALWFIPMLTIGLGLKWLKHRPYRNRLTWAANLGLPLCEWGTFYVLATLLLRREYGSGMVIPWTLASLVIVPGFAYIKRQRLIDWVNHRR